MSADNKKLDVGGEKQVIRGSGLIGPMDSGAPTLVDVKDGKITRIRPFDYGAGDADFAPWKMEARGKTFAPPLRAPLGPLGTRVQETRLFEEQGPLPAQARGLGPERRSRVHRTGRAQHSEPRHEQATCASPGTRRPSLSPPS